MSQYTPTPIDAYIKVCRNEDYTDVHHELVIADFIGNITAFEFEDASENIAKLKSDLAAEQEALAAKNAALDFAEGAIEDAIYSEDGLEGDTGQRVIAIIQEARDKGTFDKEKFGDPPKTRIELASDLAAAQEELDEAWELNGLKLNEIGHMQVQLSAAQEALRYIVGLMDEARPGMDQGAPAESTARNFVKAFKEAQEARQAAEALAAQNAKDAERYRKARANGGFFFSSDRMTDGEIDARIDELPDYAADISSGELAAAIAGEPK